MKNHHKTGKVISYAEEPELDAWEGEECNALKGTDGTVFPPLMKKEDGLWSVAPELCRSLGVGFSKRTKYMKFPAWHYTMSLPDVKEDPSLHCLCEDPEDPETCPPKGTFNLFKCLGAPLIASMPHFYNADPALLDAVDGLYPDQDKHEIFVDFELVGIQGHVRNTKCN